MITLFIGENNLLTPNFYNNTIASLQLHQLSCTCGHYGCLSVHGYYIRFLKTPDGRIPFRICRVLCSCCGHTHALLLSSFVPYSQISLADHAQIISSYEGNGTQEVLMAGNPLIDESNCRYVIRQYLHHWKQKLLSEKTSLSPVRHLILRCFTSFSRQFMQIHCTPNIIFLDTT